MDWTWVSVILFGIGFALGCWIGAYCPFIFVRTKMAWITPARQKKKSKSNVAHDMERLADIYNDFKMILVVRTDLKMGKGKIAAQCSHATLGLYKKLLHHAPKALNSWEMSGQAKVVVKVDNEENMLVLQKKSKCLELPTYVTVDAGRTQIAPDSRTVMAILGPVDAVNNVTGDLKLL